MISRHSGGTGIQNQWSGRIIDNRVVSMPVDNDPGLGVSCAEIGMCRAPEVVPVPVLHCDKPGGQLDIQDVRQKVISDRHTGVPGGVWPVKSAVVIVAGDRQNIRVRSDLVQHRVIHDIPGMQHKITPAHQIDDRRSSAGVGIRHNANELHRGIPLMPFHFHNAITGLFER